MLELLKKSPEVILNCPIWGSKCFMRNNRPLEQRHLPSLYNNVNLPSDILNTNTNGFLEFINETSLNSRLNQVVSSLEYTELKLIISNGLRKYDILINHSIINLIQPARPAYIELSNLTEKGCIAWVKLKKDQIGTPNNIIERERRWEFKLNCTLGPDFWNKCYERTRDFTFDNKIKFMQYQIVKGTLKTNHIVSKWKPGVQKECTFCNIETEDNLHLFWNCDISRSFIAECIAFLDTKWPETLTFPTRVNFLFGIMGEKVFSPRNYLYLYIKRFIWIKRCNGNLPILADFKKWFSSELNIAFNCIKKFKNLSFLENQSYRNLNDLND